MSKLLMALMVFFSVVTISYAQQRVSGYTRRDGTYVQPYYRSTPNQTVGDNYSFKGNRNPYTGQEGSSYYRNSPSSSYYGTSTGSENSSGYMGSKSSRRYGF